MKFFYIILLLINITPAFSYIVDNQQAELQSVNVESDIHERFLKSKVEKIVYEKGKKVVLIQLKAMEKILQKLESVGGFDILSDEKTEEALTTVFVALKNSMLLNPIIRYSLTDDEIRQGIIDLTIELLKADVIPYREIFVALNESGLAIDVIKFLLTDEETRQGEIDLIIELIKQLIESGAIKLEDLLKHIPKPNPPTTTTSTVVNSSPLRLSSNTSLPL